jgi:predicted ATPase
VATAATSTEARSKKIEREKEVKESVLPFNHSSFLSKSTLSQLMAQTMALWKQMVVFLSADRYVSVVYTLALMNA